MVDRTDNLLRRLGDQDADTSASAELELLRVSPSEIIAPLLRLIDDPDPAVRYRVVWILGKSKAPAAYGAIVKLTADSDSRVAYDAIMALGELGDERAEPLLKSLASLHADHPDALDSAAEMALQKLAASRSNSECTSRERDG